MKFSLIQSAVTHLQTRKSASEKNIELQVQVQAKSTYVRILCKSTSDFKFKLNLSYFFLKINCLSSLLIYTY